MRAERRRHWERNATAPDLDTWVPRGKSTGFVRAVRVLQSKTNETNDLVCCWLQEFLQLTFQPICIIVALQYKYMAYLSILQKFLVLVSKLAVS